MGRKDKERRMTRAEKKKAKQRENMTAEQLEEEKLKDFLDMNLPGNVRIFDDHIVQDDMYRAIWAIRSYPMSTTEQAILRDLGKESGITLHVYAKELTPTEQMKVIRDADNRYRMTINSETDTQKNIRAQEDYKDVVTLIRELPHTKENLVHTSVFIEMSATSLEDLKAKEMQVEQILNARRIGIDKLRLRQEQGFLSVVPGGKESFRGEFSRAIPESSVANLYPFSYAGKADDHGLRIGNDREGSYVIVDFDKHDNTHTNSNIVILGNPGEGKSYLTKGLCVNIAESGKKLLILDPNNEYGDLIKALGGEYIDMTAGKYRINILAPKVFSGQADDQELADLSGITDTFNANRRRGGEISQHISFLRDFFQTYKNLDRDQLDILEAVLQRLYVRMGITDDIDLATVPQNKFPTMTNLWNFAAEIDENFDNEEYLKTHKDVRELVGLFPRQRLADLRLAIQSACRPANGSQAALFDGPTNINTDSQVIGFGLEGIDQLDANTKNALLFNVLSYMSDKLLGRGAGHGNCCAVIDEFYLFLQSKVAAVYARNIIKQDRKYDSMMIIATQNISDFIEPSIKSLTQPIFSIPTHRFLFYPGEINVKEFKDLTGIQDNEFNLINRTSKGHCLYICGPERYSLQVSFPKYKTALFGSGGGR